MIAVQRQGRSNVTGERVYRGNPNRESGVQGPSRSAHVRRKQLKGDPRAGGEDARGALQAAAGSLAVRFPHGPITRRGRTDHELPDPVSWEP
jgi:hypothetical protein